MVCACPTTERNLGDGVVPANEYFKHGVEICLGTDSQAQIDLLEDARELEYHLRLQKLERAVLSVRSRTVREGQSPGDALLTVGHLTRRRYCSTARLSAERAALAPREGRLRLASPLISSP